MTTHPAQRDEFGWELPAEAITVRIRWFGLCVGYVLVNLVGESVHRAELNAILTLGAVYAVVDTYYSLRGRVFLSRAPLIISLMEALFIGLLCYFDTGLESPFRFYYFLSLLVCAIRYVPLVTYATFGLHALSYSTLALMGSQGEMSWPTLALMIVLMGWVTWASTALAALIKSASRRLSALNDELQENQSLLEDRIETRTQELQESQALLVQQEKQAAFGLLAAGIAHEVGNPLAAISSLVQMMNRRDVDDYMHERLGMIDDQLRRIQNTLRELVDFSRPATNEAALCDIHDALDGALSIAKYYKRKKGKQIVTHYDYSVPRVMVVRDQLVQVFLNLILNAMDATEEGGTITIATTPSSFHTSHESIDTPKDVPLLARPGVDAVGSLGTASAGQAVPMSQSTSFAPGRCSGTTTRAEQRSPPPQDRWLLVSVADDGHGIPPDRQAKLFRPYFTTKETGTGLGLFVCRRVIEQSCDGRIELTDSSAAGTTFTVSLPLPTESSPDTPAADVAFTAQTRRRGESAEAFPPTQKLPT